MHPTPAAQKPVRFVDDPADLEQCLQDLGKQRVIAFDLEFDSHRHSYGVTLCLVQVATPQVCYVIDPFALKDLGALYALFEDERILKIVHSPGEDLRLLHSLECYPKNVFDTEVVAKLLNYEQTSLAVMLNEKLGYAMSKQQQRSNWLRRPLLQEQIIYAADDVAWLHELKAVLEVEAEEKGLMPFVAEEQDALSSTIHRTEAKETFLKTGDLRSLSPYAQHVLNALFVFRDGLAQKLNKPAYQVMDEEMVRGLAAGTVLPDDVIYAKGVHHSVKNEDFADRLAAQLEKIQAEATRMGLATTPPPRQRQTQESRAARELAEQHKGEKFAPVQEALVARFGEHAARFILSNGTVNDLLKRTVTIGGLKRQYKQDLIRSIASQLGIDLSSYE